ncbi:hypothetical protein JR311_20395 (plasmid) [Bacillus velezensis]|uniref:hypothetical protein n=1 Tax=Bacillus velezensis TaxID=492670 RepID=UPI00195C0954|nr:hypothetical protein [Bacillus velezensis]QRV11384.1 hypothetical protein JR311_20395 [Bacillus velezensis]
MSQDNRSSEKAKVINNFDEECESLELNVQKALSLLEMGVAKEAAFEDALKSLDKLKELVEAVYKFEEDVVVIEIVKEKLLEAMSRFEEKI